MTGDSGSHPLKVVIASRLFLPEASAGAFRLGALARALAARGAEVDVITARPPATTTPTDPPPGVRVHRWPVLRDKGGNVRGYLQYLSFDVPLLLRILFRSFGVLVAEAPPTTGLVAALVALVRRRPLVYYAADVWSDGVRAVGAPEYVAKAVSAVERFVLRRSARVLSVSPDVSDRLMELGARKESIALVGHGIDLAVFRDDVAPQTQNGRYFVYTGTMSEVHTPEVFIRAFAAIADEYPDLGLRFFGQGVHSDELGELAARTVPGRVEISGLVAPDEAARWIRGAVAALVSLTPGIGYDYAHPTKAYAAAATGTPVLFAGPDSFGALVTSARLGVAVPHDADAVAAAMRTLLAQQESGETERERPRRSQWTRENASLERVGERAADAVLTCAR